MSSPLAGAETMTFLAPASRCLRASSALVKRPVDSMTTSAPSSPHGSAVGSFSWSTLMLLSPTWIPSPVTLTGSGSVPSTVSYFSRWARVLPSVRSFTATTSMSEWLAATTRQKLRPIRPKPLTPTRVATFVSLESLEPVGRSVTSPGTTRAGPKVTTLRPDRRTDRSGVVEQVRGDPRLGRRQAVGQRPLVGEREQPADPPGDRVLGHRRVGQRPEL